MIDQLDAQQQSGLSELCGDRNILWAGVERTLRMVMNTDDRFSPVGDRISINIPWMDKAVVEQSYCDDPAVKHLACAIESDIDEMLLSFPPHFSDYWERENVL